LICLSALKVEFVPGFIAGALPLFPLPDCASAVPIIPSWAAAIVKAALPRKERRGRLHSSLILIGNSPDLKWNCWCDLQTTHLYPNVNT
jgi:hypothetical protein